MYQPEVFCLSNDEVLMKGQESQPVLPEDIYDEANWGSEQVRTSSCNRVPCVFIEYTIEGVQ